MQTDSNYTLERWIWQQGLKLKLTLEQHRFGLWSTFYRHFFPQNKYYSTLQSTIESVDTDELTIKIHRFSPVWCVRAPSSCIVQGSTWTYVYMCIYTYMYMYMCSCMHIRIYAPTDENLWQISENMKISELFI